MCAFKIFEKLITLGYLPPYLRTIGPCNQHFNNFFQMITVLLSQ